MPTTSDSSMLYGPWLHDYFRDSTAPMSLVKPWLQSSRGPYDHHFTPGASDIDKWPSILGQDILGQTALHYYSSGDRLPSTAIRSIIAAGVDVNAQDIVGRTALHIVCTEDVPSPREDHQIEIIKILLEHPNTDIGLKSHGGFHAYDDAMEKKKKDILECFRFSIHLNPKSDLGKSIHKALFERDSEEISPSFSAYLAEGAPFEYLIQIAWRGSTAKQISFKNRHHFFARLDGQLLVTIY